MWLLIPSSALDCALGPEVSNSGSKSLSPDTAPSVWWNGKLRSQAEWRRASAKDRSLSLLSGMTLPASDGRPWRGVVHIVSAGFPCQPWSVAGKRAGTKDARWIWPDIARIIGEVEPEIVFLENVPGLLLDPDSGADRWDVEESADDALGGMGTALRDLAGLGFDAEWLCVRASDVGASHQRKRVFVLAHREHGRRHARRPGEVLRGALASWRRPENGSEPLAHAGRPERRWPKEPAELDRPRASDRDCEAGEPLADASSPRRSEDARGAPANEAADGRARRLPCEPGGDYEPQRLYADMGELPAFAPGPRDPRWADLLVRFPWMRPSLSQAEAIAHLRGVADGLAALVVNERTGALRALGNGVVPLQAALAFVELSRRAGLKR
jgi:DNA (cytosine-5)-methyltransferase 1